MDCEIITKTTNKFTYYVNLQRSDLNITNKDSIISILDRLLYQPTSRRCNNCNDILYKNISLLDPPELLIIHLPYTDVKINTSFKLCYKSYKLKCVVYYGNNHYTSFIISTDNSIWYHDGIETGRNMLSNKNNKSKKWNKYNDKNAVLFVYICT